MSKKYKGLQLKVKLDKGKILINEGREAKQNVETISLRHGVPEWYMFLKNITTMGVHKADLVNIFEIKKDEKSGFPSYEELDDKDLFAGIQKELTVAFKGEEKPLTEDQKRIAELEAKIDALSGVKTVTPKESVAPESNGKEEAEAPEDEGELQELREEFEKITGRKAHHTSTVKTLRAHIEKAKANQA